MLLWLLDKNVPTNYVYLGRVHVTDMRRRVSTYHLAVFVLSNLAGYSDNEVAGY